MKAYIDDKNEVHGMDGRRMSMKTDIYLGKIYRFEEVEQLTDRSTTVPTIL